MKKFVIIWFLAAVITAGSAYYQRKTGPTYPLDATANLNGVDYSFELIRTREGEGAWEISLPINDPAVSGSVNYRRYRTEDNWTSVDFKSSGEALTASLPGQPPAGKLEYYLTLADQRRSIDIGKASPVVVRFKGHVPLYVLFPHVGFMLAAMFFSAVAGMAALIKDKSFRLYTYLAFGLLIIGGLVLGPAVQYFAFGSFWTGVPFGWDLTDNKTLVAFAALLIAVVGIRKKDRYYLTVSAAVIMLVVFLIPHSLFGSELDYSTGAITTR
jgi:hypothetical protein